MSKKFTLKPIKTLVTKTAGQTELTSANEVSQEKFDDFYKHNGGSVIEKPKVGPGIWGLVILVSILFGFGSALLYNFLFNNNPGATGNQNVVIDKKENVTVTSEEQLAAIAENINPVMVNFYDDSTDVSGPFYQDIYSLGSGFILTSNGWLVTTQSVLDKIAGKDFVVLTADYKVYRVEKTLTDPISAVVFMKITANDLPVAKLGEISSAHSGQKVYGFIANYPEAKIASLHLADLQATTLDDVVDSTEKFAHFVTAREGYDPSLAGAPIVNLAGEIVAIIADQQTAIPTQYLTTAIADLSKKDKIDRAYFGVHYINLAKYPKIDRATAVMRDNGALLSGYKNLLAVAKGSPADKAGLQVGDIITMIEDEPVNGRVTLTQMIQEYEPGQKIKLIIIRNNQEQKIEVELGKIE